MIVHNLEQKSDAWHNFRAIHFGASEASAMLGLSPHTSRTKLLDYKKTGIEKEVDSFTQSIFDKGNEIEKLAMPIVQKILGIDLWPVTVSLGKLSASCDGLSDCFKFAWENKQYNKSHFDMVKNGELPSIHWPQCQQILLVTGAEKLYFTISDGTEENTVGVFVMPDKTLKKQIINGWNRFELDLDAHVPVEAIEKPKANAIKELPYLNIQLHGEVVNSNLPAVQQSISTFIANIKTDLVTDEDFADAEATVKFCKDAEEGLENAKKSALSQTASIDELMRTIDFIKNQLRDKRLVLDKVVVDEKEKRKNQIVSAAKLAYSKYVADNGRVALHTPDFAAAIKGKKLPSKMQSAVDDLLAQSKIEFDEQLLIINKNQELFDKIAINHKFLFVDLSLFIQNEPELFELKVKDRIAKYEIEQKELAAKKEVIEPIVDPERLVMQKNTALNEIVIDEIPQLIEIIRCLAKGFNVKESIALSWLNNYADFRK